MEKDRFIALLPFCDTVCEYDRSCGKLRVCKTGLAQGISDKWYSVDELRNIFRDGCAVSAKRMSGRAISAAKTCAAFSMGTRITTAFACVSGRAGRRTASTTSVSTGWTTTCW